MFLVDGHVDVTGNRFVHNEPLNLAGSRIQMINGAVRAVDRLGLGGRPRRQLRPHRC